MPITITPGVTISGGVTFLGAPPPLSISFVSSAIYSVNFSSGTTSPVVLPAAIQANDIIVVYCTTGSSLSSTPPTQTTPTGYTLIDSVTASSVPDADAERANLYYKVAVAEDAGATLTITSSSSDFRAICVAVFRTNKGSAPTITTASINSFGGTASPSNQTVTAGSGAAPLIVFGAYVNTATQTFTPTQTGEVVTANTRVLRYGIYNSAPANTTVGSTISSTTICMQSFYMTVSEEAPPPPYFSYADPVSGFASGGTPVTIYGEFFTGATSVTFGGVAAATFTVVDDFTIEATTAAGSNGIGLSIAVTTPGGTTDPNTEWTYYTLPTVTSGGSQPVEGGRSATITGTGFTGATSVTCIGVGQSFTVVNDTTIFIPSTTPTFAPPLTVGSVLVTTPFGTSTPNPNDFWFIEF